jgi:hypothetical protein
MACATALYVAYRDRGLERERERERRPVSHGEIKLV